MDQEPDAGNSVPSFTEEVDDTSRWNQLLLLSVAVLCAMSLWFSVSAVEPQLTEAWGLTDGQRSWLTTSVQLGFAVGTLVSAVLNLADRLATQRFLACCATFGACCNAAIAVGISDEWAGTGTGFFAVAGLRFLTGVSMAGVYPPGMKLVATWFQRGRGTAIGVMVGAVTIGSASPRLILALNQSGAADWRFAMLTASALAVVAAILSWGLVRSGPFLRSAPKFDWAYFAKVWRQPALRRANFGYLGHMFELYAMWTWCPIMLRESYLKAGWPERSALFVGFSIMAVGGLGCVLAGLFADRVGRTMVTIVSLVASGACAVTAGFLFDAPLVLTVVCLIWGFAVVADSAQFSAAITELADSRLVGTALTIQTCAGFLLTMVTIRLVPSLESSFGWGPAFALLVIGPIFGVWHMLRLRWMPEARQLATGRR